MGARKRLGWAFLNCKVKPEKQCVRQLQARYPPDTEISQATIGSSAKFTPPCRPTPCRPTPPPPRDNAQADGGHPPNHKVVQEKQCVRQLRIRHPPDTQRIPALNRSSAKCAPLQTPPPKGRRAGRRRAWCRHVVGGRAQFDLVCRVSEAKRFMHLVEEIIH